MSTADEQLHALLDTFSEIRDFLTAHGVASEWARFAYLAGVASGDGSSAQVLRDTARAYGQVAGRRDGIGDLYLTDAAGGVDREASQALDALKDRLASLLEDW